MNPLREAADRIAQIEAAEIAWEPAALETEAAKGFRGETNGFMVNVLQFARDGWIGYEAVAAFKTGLVMRLPPDLAKKLWHQAKNQRKDTT